MVAATIKKIMLTCTQPVSGSCLSAPTGVGITLVGTTLLDELDLLLETELELSDTVSPPVSATGIRVGVTGR